MVSISTVNRRRRRRPALADRATHDPAVEHHHRDVRGGAARAAVFGVSDGLVSNISLILGVAGAHPAAGVVRLAGLAGLVAGACSMAAGEWVSMQAQSELLQRELDIERRELDRNPHREQRELARIYEKRGIEPDAAHDLAAQMMRDPKTALETHAREELGIDPGELGSPAQAAGASFLSFALGAVVPLVPWFVSRGLTAVVASIGLGLVMSVLVGMALGMFTGRSMTRTTIRQLMVSTGAAGVTYGIGALVGVSGVS